VSRLDRVTLQLGVAVACVIALCSYAVSATSLYALGLQAGYSWWQAAAVPVVADGPAIYGMFRIVSRSRRGAPGAGYGWLLVGCGTLASIWGNVAHAHPEPGRPGHRRRHPAGRPGHAGGSQRRCRRGHRLAAQAAGHRPVACVPSGERPPATSVHRIDPPPGPRVEAPAVGAQRPALPAAVKQANGPPVGVRLQAAYAQPRADGQAWTARTLADAAGCGRSSAAAFLQRHRPAAQEPTT
jgi:hypothetical protein